MAYSIQEFNENMQIYTLSFATRTKTHSIKKIFFTLNKFQSLELSTEVMENTFRSRPIQSAIGFTFLIAISSSINGQAILAIIASPVSTPMYNNKSYHLGMWF